jgi:XTP/dITP diphosphohydrolase
MSQGEANGLSSATPPPSARVRPIVLATGNPHKIDELRAILANVGAPILSLGDVPGGPFTEPAETGATFVENATIKALSYARATGNCCLADDSGLEIDALDGRPGVISSHYATDGRETGLSRAQRDGANNALVQAQMLGVPWQKRGARFVCVMVLAAPAPSQEQGAVVLARSRGVFEGCIGLTNDEARALAQPTLVVPRGEHGFGYDPLFLVPGAREGAWVSSAELTPQEKHAHSHRGAAARAMARQISQLWPSASDTGRG